MTTIASTKPNAAQRRQRLSTVEASRRLAELPAADLDSSEVVSEVVDIAAGLTGALGVVFLARDSEQEDRLTVSADHYAPQHLSHLRSLLQFIARLGNAACAEEAPQAGSPETDKEILVVAVPVLGGKQGPEALAVAISVDSESQARSSAAYLTQILTWVAASIGPLRYEKLRLGSQAENANLREVESLLQKVTEQDTFPQGCRVLGDWVRYETGSPVVVIGVQQGWQGSCQVVTHSGSNKLDTRSRNVSILRELLEETIIAADHEDKVDESALGTSAAASLSRVAGMELIARYPLRKADGRAYGAMLCMRAASDEATTEQRRLPKETLDIVGRQLWMMKCAQRNSLVRMLGLEHIRKRWYRHPFVWSTAIALTLLMLVPMPLKVKSSCQVQPRHRRYVCVPYEGRLEEALTEPGEIVRKGQLLAKMDGREIQFEISGLTAELRRVGKDRDTALAAYDTAASQIAQLEARRLQLKIDLLEQRLENLEIRSPVDGVVMGGDPRKLEGARMSIGDTLLEVGPMDQMIVELAILDEDISHVRVGQQVRYRLSAKPWKALEGPITLIHPRSEARDGKNVFIAEVELQNDSEIIRPGMHGRASVRGDYHPLGWNLFHKAWDSLVTWVAW